MNSDEVIENAWMRARAECECRAKGHGHGSRCAVSLVWTHRGEPGGWEVFKKKGPDRAGWQAVNQCVILCWHCYQQLLGTHPRHKEVA